MAAQHWLNTIVVQWKWLNLNSGLLGISYNKRIPNLAFNTTYHTVPSVHFSCHFFYGRNIWINHWEWHLGKGPEPYFQAVWKENTMGEMVRWQDGLPARRYCELPYLLTAWLPLRTQNVFFNSAQMEFWFVPADLHYRTARSDQIAANNSLKITSEHCLIWSVIPIILSVHFSKHFWSEMWESSV